MTAGDRRLVREAVAAYFGGTMQTEDDGIYFQGGPLSSLGLGTAYPYKIKRGAPDQYYTLGETDGTGWGAVLTVTLGPEKITRQAMGGATSGFRSRHYTTYCALDIISYEPHLETTEAGVDDLIDAFLQLIYDDRTLGSTNAELYPNPPYPGNRLIVQAGEGREGIDVGEATWTVDGDRGRGEGGLLITFDTFNSVMA